MPHTGTTRNMQRWLANWHKQKTHTHRPTQAPQKIMWKPQTTGVVKRDADAPSLGPTGLRPDVFRASDHRGHGSSAEVDVRGRSCQPVDKTGSLASGSSGMVGFPPSGCPSFLFFLIICLFLFQILLVGLEVGFPNFTHQ